MQKSFHSFRPNIIGLMNEGGMHKKNGLPEKGRILVTFAYVHLELQNEGAIY